MRKTIIKIIIGIICAAVLLLMVIRFTVIGGAEISNGTYKVTNCEEYPDAYVVVEGNLLQFYNIDLNTIYQEYQMEAYKKLEERGLLSFDVTAEELSLISDLNRMFVQNAYEIDYELEGADSKSGTFTYIYFCYGKGNLFGMVIEYNSLQRTLQINSPVRQLIFKK